MSVGSIGSSAVNGNYPAAGQKNKSNAIEPMAYEQDIVTVSEYAQQMSQGSSVARTSWTKSELSAAKPTMASMRKYLNLGMGEGNTSLVAMNMNRESLGARIESALSKGGIKLNKNEKISISVNAKNEIKVTGIKDKGKREAIEKALNDDEKLGRELRKHVANSKINEYTEKQKNFETDMRESGMSSTEGASFDNPGMRSLIMEEYLQEKAGLSLSDLSLGTDEAGDYTIAGANEQLLALMESDEELGSTLAGMLERGETNTDFAATFEYANGTISDNSTVTAAKDKLNGVKEQLLAITGGFLKEMDDAGIELPEDFRHALEYGFTITAGLNGDFEIVGLDDMEPRYRDKLNMFVQQAIENWAGTDKKKTHGPGKIDEYTGGEREPTFADAVKAYVDQHEYEHGDTDEFEHGLQIDLVRTGGEYKVVSPEADKARDKENQQMADQLGEGLRGVLQEKNIDATGLEFEIDEKGKITVLGDPENELVKRAQQAIDQWVQQTRAQGAADNQPEKDEEEENGALVPDSEDKAYTPEGVGKQSVAASTGDEAYKQQQWTQFRNEHFEKVKDSLPDGPHLEANQNVFVFAKYLGWQRVMGESGSDGVASLGKGEMEKVSNIRPPQYANSYDDNTSDPAGLYLKLVDSMGQFHDGRQHVSYRSKIA